MQIFVLFDLKIIILLTNSIVEFKCPFFVQLLYDLMLYFEVYEL